MHHLKCVVQVQSICCAHRSQCSLRSRRLEVVGERENGRARGRHVRGEGPLSPRVSPFRAPVFSCAHYLQAPATQANLSVLISVFVIVIAAARW